MSKVLRLEDDPDSQDGTWLVLSCGHRYKWSGRLPRPFVGQEVTCPEDSPIVVDEEGDAL